MNSINQWLKGFQQILKKPLSHYRKGFASSGAIEVMRERSVVLNSLVGLSYRCGGPILWDWLRSGRVKILMYHGITDSDRFEGVANRYGYKLSVEQFERQLLYLQQHCQMISLDDFLCGRGLSQRKTNIVLTFDDGYENNYRNAYPLLCKFGLPATFALPTDFVCHRVPHWNDVIEDAVNRAPNGLVKVSCGGASREFATGDLAERLGLYIWLMHESCCVEQSQRDALIRSAMDQLGLSIRSDVMFENMDYRPLMPEQIHEMARSELVEFASHSVRHLLLSKLPRDAKRAELEESKCQVESLTERPCRTFSTPGGDYDAEMLEEAFLLGYECVLTSDTGPAKRTQRVLNRDCMFRQDNMERFADVVHGPVIESVAAMRRTVRAVFNSV